VPTATTENVPLSEVTVLSTWDDEKRLLELPVGENGTVGVIKWVRADGRGMVIKLGFDREFNPVLQLGGDMISPDRPLTMDPYSVEAWMNPSWMEGPAHSNYAHKADRLRGLDEEVFLYCERISIQEGAVGETGTRGWVVDIVDSEEPKYPRYADICEGYINASTSVPQGPPSKTKPI
jgi:hypothetical protein